MRRRADDRVELPPNFLLLRGLARHQKHWAGFDSHLAATLGVTVHHLDLPGFGTEHTREAPLTIDATMSDVRERWQSLAETTNGSWALMAISLGGMVAMSWSHHHADDFVGQVIMNSSARNLGKPWERMQMSALSHVVRAMVSNDPVLRERNILEATSTNTPDVEAAAQASAELDAFAPMTRKNVLRQLTAATRYAAPSIFETPTLLLAAAGDRLANRACSERLADRTGAPLRIHPTSGHDLPRDAPDWIIDELRSWFVDSD